MDNTITFKKEGLEGENLKLVEFLNTRLAKLDLNTLSKEEIELMVRSAVGKFDGIDVAKLKEFTQDDDKGLRSILLAQGTEIEKLKAGQKNAPEDLSIRAQVAKWMEINKDAIEGAKHGKRADLPALQLRAPITMTNGTSLGGSVYLPNAMVQPGFVDLNRTEPTFWQRLAKGVTKANPFVWVNKTNKQGNAQFIGEGVLKPLASFELSSESSTPKKVAERMKVSTEMLHDVDGLTSMIEQELRFEVETAANAAVLTGVASSTNPKGVTQYAALFTLTTVKATTPNNLDAIRAAVAQLKLLNFVNGIVAYINPIDAANMDLAKGSDGHYILPPFTTSDGRSISGGKWW